MSRLAGWRVLVTRQPEQAHGLAQALEREGATVIEVPLIETAPPEDPRPLAQAIARLGDYDWLVFASANAVHAFAAAFGERALPQHLRVATVGASTTRAVLESLPGAAVALTPPEQEARAEGLVAAFASHDLKGLRVLVPASARARDTLAAGLVSQGAQVEVVTAYRTVMPPDAPARLGRALAEGVALVTLASPSAVEGFVSSCPAGVRWPPAVVIGPVTEKAAREAGLRVAGRAVTADADGLVAAMVELTRQR